VCINKKAFLREIRENLTLFRYCLGPLATPEGILQAFVSAKDPIAQVLKKNTTLLQILLGHGLQNAMLHARLLEIEDSSNYDQVEEFPFIQRKLRQAKNWPTTPASENMNSYFGF